MTWTEIEVLRQGRAGIVRFHRPQALNALTDQMLIETRSAMEPWTNDPDVVAIVLTGSDRAFCSGGTSNAPRRLFSRHTTSIGPGSRCQHGTSSPGSCTAILGP